MQPVGLARWKQEEEVEKLFIKEPPLWMQLLHAVKAARADLSVGKLMMGWQKWVTYGLK